MERCNKIYTVLLLLGVILFLFSFKEFNNSFFNYNILFLCSSIPLMSLSLGKLIGRSVDKTEVRCIKERLSFIKRKKRNSIIGEEYYEYFFFNEEHRKIRLITKNIIKCIEGNDYLVDYSMSTKELLKIEIVDESDKCIIVNNRINLKLSYVIIWIMFCLFMGTVFILCPMYQFGFDKDSLTEKNIKEKTCSIKTDNSVIIEDENGIIYKLRGRFVTEEIKKYLIDNQHGGIISLMIDDNNSIFAIKDIDHVILNIDKVEKQFKSSRLAFIIMGIFAYFMAIISSFWLMFRIINHKLLDIFI